MVGFTGSNPILRTIFTKLLSGIHRSIQFSQIQACFTLFKMILKADRGDNFMTRSFV